MTQTSPQRKFDIQFVAALLLLAPALLFTWRTMDGLAKRRLLRMDQAEIGHVRYSMLNADRWVDQILPILNGKIDALDLTAQTGASLRPTVEQALYRLLDRVKEQGSKPAPGAAASGFAAQANAMIANMMITNLRPRVATAVAGSSRHPFSRSRSRRPIRKLSWSGMHPMQRPTRSSTS